MNHFFNLEKDSCSFSVPNQNRNTEDIQVGRNKFLLKQRINLEMVELILHLSFSPLGQTVEESTEFKSISVYSGSLCLNPMTSYGKNRQLEKAVC